MTTLVRTVKPMPNLRLIPRPADHRGLPGRTLVLPEGQHAPGQDSGNRLCSVSEWRGRRRCLCGNGIGFLRGGTPRPDLGSARVRRGFVWCSRGWFVAALVALGLSPATVSASLFWPAGDSDTASVANLAYGSPQTAQHPAPVVEGAEPSGDRVPISSAITVTFSQPMSRRSVERSFVIEPRVEGRFGWVDDFTIRFQPYRLARGVSYELEGGGRSRQGTPLIGLPPSHFTPV